MFRKPIGSCRFAKKWSKVFQKQNFNFKLDESCSDNWDYLIARRLTVSYCSIIVVQWRQR